MRLRTRLITIAAGGMLLALPSVSSVSALADTPHKNGAPVADSMSAQPAPGTEAGIHGSAPAQMKPALESGLGKDGLPKETEEELRLVELTNQERARHGLGKLTIDTTLIGVARQHSAEMRDKRYFDHQSPTPGLKTPMDRYLKVVSSEARDPRFYACVGENLYWATLVDVNRAHEAFMNSPTHRENVLFARYDKVAVGIVKNERGEFWVTEMFLTNADPKSSAKKMARGR
jgi:uncharacterized protein YkwD